MVARAPRVLCGRTLVLLWLLVLTAAASVATAGNITLEGPTGLFINPAAEVTPARAFTPQACWLHLDTDAGDLDGIAATGSYTFSTNTELGLFFEHVDPPAGDDDSAAGALVRQLVVEMQDYRPAVAVGGAFLEGDVIERQMVYAAIKQPLTPADVAVAVYLHLGGKWRFSGSTDDGTAYGGVELVFGDGRWSFLGEYGTESDFETDSTWSAGFQYHGRGGLGVSLAVIDLGTPDDDLATYFGIGYLFTGD